MGQGHTGESPLRSKKPAGYELHDETPGPHSGIDFSQYKTSQQPTKNSKFNKPMQTNNQPANTRKPANIGGIEGDIYLNDRLKYLEVQRAQIHAMADRYGLLTHP
jgi:hypothetical protein